jgi:hypothetical protein
MKHEQLIIVPEYFPIKPSLQKFKQHFAPLIICIKQIVKIFYFYTKSKLIENNMKVI